MKIRILQLILFIFIGVQSMAQTGKMDSKEKGSYFKADLNYLNDLVYLGRKDSLNLPYLTATMGYYHPSGFFITGALSYSPTASANKFDLFTLDAGYDFSINDVFTGSIYGEKYFYNKSSNSIKSNITGILDGSLSADLNFLQIGVEAGLSFASKLDYTTTFSIAHLVNFDENEKGLSINPSLNINFSTLNFYEGVTNNKFGKKHLANNPNYVSVSSTTTAKKQGFSLMDLELSIPIEYKINGLGIYINPTFAIPKNPISTITNATINLRNGTVLKQQFDSTPWSEKNLNNLFYLELGLNYSF